MADDFSYDPELTQAAAGSNAAQYGLTGASLGAAIGTPLGLTVVGALLGGLIGAVSGGIGGVIRSRREQRQTAEVEEEAEKAEAAATYDLVQQQRNAAAASVRASRTGGIRGTTPDDILVQASPTASDFDHWQSSRF